MRSPGESADDEGYGHEDDNDQTPAEQDQAGRPAGAFGQCHDDLASPVSVDKRLGNRRIQKWINSDDAARLQELAAIRDVNARIEAGQFEPRKAGNKHADGGDGKM